VNDDQIIDLGNYAETVLTNQNFNIILEQFDQATIKLMLSTKPDQLKERERVFASINGAREFIAFMQEFVVQKERLLNPPKIDDHDDPLVHDIYRQD
jgi:predicted nucleic-acid-binding protein